MKCLILTTILFIFAVEGLGQQSGSRPSQTTAQMSEGTSSNLPMQPLGQNDLIGLQVYDSPELSRTFRVGADGTLHLPMLKQRINALGLLPNALEAKISDALIGEHIMNQPIITVSVVEYQSRPIHVVGAFRNPLTFEATPPVTVLDAIAKAGGASDNAGPEILLTRTQTGSDGQPTHITQRITLADLMQNSDPGLDLELHGGEEIRLPEAGRIYVVGDVKKPGEYLIKNSAETSVLKALSLSEGLDANAARTAYIYRKDGGTGTTNQIPFDLRQIMDRKAPDVPLLPNDILYVADNKNRRNAMATLDKILMLSGGIGSALVYTAIK